MEVPLTELRGPERARYVQGMFTDIAQRYDMMNRVMTAGQDIRWRREVIRRAALPRGGKILDLGTGTGDLAREALRQQSEVQVVAADFTLEMMRVGQKRTPHAENKITPLFWTASDAGNLPFVEHTFDATVSGFLLRNVSDLDRCLREQLRVLKPGGRIVTLDTTPPPKSPLAPMLRFHLHTVIPTLGQLLAGQKEAYTYLPDSTEGFLEPERLAMRMLSAGFMQVGFRRLMFGTVAIHWGYKPQDEE
jgi:demethylmenaquinone methyltransferase/2-methoxy-6-polyprenyl-1,4-benzoquinol methylase